MPLESRVEIDGELSEISDIGTLAEVVDIQTVAAVEELQKLVLLETLQTVQNVESATVDSITDSIDIANINDSISVSNITDAKAESVSVSNISDAKAESVSVSNISDAKAQPIWKAGTGVSIGLAEQESVTVPAGKMWKVGIVADSSADVQLDVDGQPAEISGTDQNESFGGTPLSTWVDEGVEMKAQFGPAVVTGIEVTK